MSSMVIGNSLQSNNPINWNPWQLIQLGFEPADITAALETAKKAADQSQIISVTRYLIDEKWGGRVDAANQILAADLERREKIVLFASQILGGLDRFLPTELGKIVVEYGILSEDRSN